MVTPNPLKASVTAQPTVAIDAVLLDKNKVQALDEDIIAMVRWLMKNDYLELDTNANCRATDKMLQV